MSGVPSTKIRVPLHPGQRSDAAVSAVLRALLELIVRLREGAVIGADPEYLHGLRVSVRRTRTVQRQLAGVFPAQSLPGFRSEFRWLQRTTGEARDLDVYLEGFEDLRAMIPKRLGQDARGLRRDLDPLRMVLGHWRLVSLGEMGRVLLSRRTTELLTDWEMLLESLVEVPMADRPEAAAPIGQLAGRRIRRLYERIVSMGETMGADTPAEEFHALRKKGKELRYLLELFGQPLFGAEVVDPLVKSLKGLQDVLGRHQDRQVQTGVLLSLADEVAELPGGARAVLAMGALIDRIALDERAARDEFAERYTALADPEQRRLITDTFTEEQD